jgi:Zn-dependent protease
MAAERAPIPTREERAARLFAIEREAAAVARRVFVAVILICFFWMCLGLFLLAWAFHTTNEAMGRIALYAGILVTDVGVLGTLIYAYNRAEREGWL